MAELLRVTLWNAAREPDAFHKVICNSAAIFCCRSPGKINFHGRVRRRAQICRRSGRGPSLCCYRGRGGIRAKVVYRIFRTNAIVVNGGRRQRAIRVRCRRRCAYLREVRAASALASLDKVTAYGPARLGRGGP